jgi:hypothetical protein
LCETDPTLPRYGTDFILGTISMQPPDGGRIALAFSPCLAT